MLRVLILACGLFVGSALANDFQSTKRAAENGNVEAQYQLSLMYYYAEGVEQSYYQAYLWSKKAAEKGHSGAAYNLGYFYQNGDGVRQSDELAKEWFGRACDYGNQQGCDAYKNMEESGYFTF